MSSGTTFSKKLAAHVAIEELSPELRLEVFRWFCQRCGGAKDAPDRDGFRACPGHTSHEAKKPFSEDSTL